MNKAGVKSFSAQKIIYAKNWTAEAACLAHRVLGTISPKINTKIVSAPVAIATASDPKCSKATMETNAAAVRLTTLFPIRMVDRSRWGFCLRDSAKAPARRPSSFKVCNRLSGREKNAISAPENKPENTKQIRMARYSMGSDQSKTPILGNKA